MKSRSSLYILAIMAFAVGLRIEGLFQSFWFDELFSTRLFFADWSSLFKVFLKHTHPPLPYLITFLWTGLFGESEVSVRLPSLIFGVATIPALYVLGQRLFDRKTAIVGCLLLALSPAHIWYSTEARPYTMLALCLTLITLAVVESSRPNSDQRWLILYAGALISASLTHYYVFAICAYLLLCPLFLRPGHRRSLVIIPLVSGMVLLCTVLIQFNLSENFRVEVWHARAFSFLEWWFLYFNWFPFGNTFTLGASEYVPRRGIEGVAENLNLAVMFLFHLALFCATSHAIYVDRKRMFHDTPYSIYLGLLFFPALFLVLTAVGLEKTYIERSAFLVLPLFLLFLARGLTGISSRLVRRVATLSVVAMMVFAVLRSHQLDSVSVLVEGPRLKPDWKSASEYLSQRAASAQRINILCTHSISVLKFYDPKIRQLKVRVKNIEDIEKRVVWMTRGQTGYAVNNRYRSSGFPVLYKALKAIDFIEVEEPVRFRGVEIYPFKSSPIEGDAGLKR